MTTEFMHRAVGASVWTIFAFLALTSRALCKELYVRTYDASFPFDYAQTLLEDRLRTGGNFTAALLDNAQGIALNDVLYPNGDTNFAWLPIDEADTFYNVAFANESLTDARDITVPERNSYVNPSERAAVIRHLTNGQPTYVFNGLLSKFRDSMGTRCGAFPRGCYATPTRLNKASEELNGFLVSFYSKLVEAFNQAATKLDQNEYSDDYRSVCTAENIDRIWCEVETIQSVMGDECGNVTSSHCSPPRETSACIWREIDVDDFDNMAYTVRIRLTHLLMAKAFCGLKDDRREEMVSKLLSIANGFLNAERTKSLGMLSDSQEVDGWMGTVPGIVDGAAKKLLLPEGYPNSSAVVRNYTWLAGNVSQALTGEWNKYSASINLSQPLDEEWANVLCESFGSFVFYPGQESDYAPPAKVKTLKDKWDKEEVQNTLILYQRRAEANILIWKKRSDACSDSEKRDWIKENKERLVDALGNWKNGNVSTLQSKIGAFKSDLRAWHECFRSVAIVRCAYRFVWYELGWTYFHATSDCDDFCVKVGGEGYRQCLSIVFLG